MSKKGLLKFDDFGYSMPVTDPAYSEPPYYYRSIEAISVSYETDYESVATMLPEPLTFTNDPPVATLMFSNIPFSTFGEYREAILMFSCQYKGKDYLYLPNLFVTQEDPMLGGREIWGYHKKLAELEFKHERNQITGSAERPVGNKLFDVTVSPKVNLKFEDWKNTTLLSLKKIPSCDGNGIDVCQLVGCEYILTPLVGSDGLAELWSGIGSVSYYKNVLQNFAPVISPSPGVS